MSKITSSLCLSGNNNNNNNSGSNNRFATWHWQDVITGSSNSASYDIAMRKWAEIDLRTEWKAENIMPLAGGFWLNSIQQKTLA